LWVDLLVCPKSREEFVRIAELCRKMGYSTLGVESSFFEREQEFVKRCAAEASVETLPVAYVKGRGWGHARSAVERARSARTVIVGVPTDAASLRLFSRDKRVRVVEITRFVVKYLDRNEAALLREGGSMLGLNLSALLRSFAALSWMSKAVGAALKYGVPLVAYSSAAKWSEVWHPRSVYALFESMGYPGRLGLSALKPPIVT